VSGLNLKFEIDFKEWVTKYTEIWIGPFSLTKKEVEILNEIQMIYLQLEEAGKVTGEIESFLFENRFGIGNALDYKNLAFRKHLKNLSEKGCIMMKDDRLIIHKYLIPKKELSFSFNVKDFE
jgi:hypothetical protein